MKRFLTTTLAICGLGLLILPSCKKAGQEVIATGGKPGTLTSTSTNLTLDKSKLNDPSAAITFNFTSANYGYSAAVVNTLQIDSAGDNWKKPHSTKVATNANLQTFSTSDFNALLLSLNLTGGQPGQINARIMHSISANIPPTYSNVVSMTVTPFNLASYLWVPGAYQGWNPGAAHQLVSPVSNNIYSGIINFTGADLTFKVTDAANWNGTNYGAGATAGTISSTGGNLTAPADGAFMVTVNLTANTIVYLPEWSIIGDATPGGWGGDTNMLYDYASGNYYITANLVSDGSQAIKFRLNNSWTINLGGSNGTLSLNGANINIPATGAGGASYTVTLNPTDNTYTLVKN